MIPQGVPSVLADEYLRRATAISTETARAATALTDAQLRWHPPGGGWSVGETLEHLVITNAFFLPKMSAVVAAAAPAPAPRPWKPSFFGKLILRAIDPANQGKTKAPRVFTPGPVARAGVVAAFLAQLAEYRAVVVRSAHADWNRIRLSSPIAAIIRVNLGDALASIVLHGERHLNQVRRVTEQPGFPR